jgi:hypothetical protein
VALIQRGGCTLEEKVSLAVGQGAAALVIFNEGQAPDRTTFAFGSVDFGCCGPGFVAVTTSYEVGFELYNLVRSAPVTVHIVTNVEGDGFTSTAGPAANNTLIKNTGLRNAYCDGVDFNRSPPCGSNAWIANELGVVNASCVDPEAMLSEFGPSCNGPTTGTGAIAHHY